MSSSVYIPAASGGGSFTPPTSISVKTASYTIPVGKYAKAKGFFINSGSGTGATYTLRTLTINGNDVYYDDKFIITRSNITVATNAAFFTVPNPFKGKMNFYFYNGGASQQSIKLETGNIYYLYDAIPIGTKVVGTHDVVGGVTFYAGVGTITQQYLRMQFLKDQDIGYIEEWVPSGTVLSGNTASSFNWIVEEYTV